MICNVCHTQSVSDTCKCTCQACGVGLAPRLPGTRGPVRKYCLYCRDNRQRQMAVDRICRWCGSTYWTTSKPRKGRGRTVACSEECLRLYSHFGVKYGLSLETLEAMKTAQNSRCAICSSSDRLVVDHSHETGEVRGLLCHACNVALGLLKDSPDVIIRAAEYLRMSLR